MAELKGRVFLLLPLLFACCPAPEEDTTLSMSTSSRILIGEVCLAYDDARADSTRKPSEESRQIRKRAEEICDEVTALP